MRPFSFALAIAVCLASTAVLHSDWDDVRSRESDGSRRFAFALIGDMPYGAEGDAKFPQVIADINADRTLSFVVHDGDFKNGSSVCSDIVFQNRLELFNQFERPLIFMPGDNEWTDCHRANNGTYDPLERLVLLRSMFFPTDQSLGKRTLTLARQSDERSTKSTVRTYGGRLARSSSSACTSSAAITTSGEPRPVTRSTGPETPPTLRGCRKRSLPHRPNATARS